MIFEKVIPFFYQFILYILNFRWFQIPNYSSADGDQIPGQTETVRPSYPSQLLQSTRLVTNSFETLWLR